MLVEVVLQLLIGDVDTELLKRVVLQILKPENVQKSDGQGFSAMITNNGHRSSVQGFPAITTNTGHPSAGILRYDDKQRVPIVSTN